MTAEQALAKISLIIGGHPAGSLEGWGKIQVVLMEYANTEQDDAEVAKALGALV